MSALLLGPVIRTRLEGAGSIDPMARNNSAVVRRMRLAGTKATCTGGRRLGARPPGGAAATASVPVSATAHSTEVTPTSADAAELLPASGHHTIDPPAAATASGTPE